MFYMSFEEHCEEINKYKKECKIKGKVDKMTCDICEKTIKLGDGYIIDGFSNKTFCHICVKDRMDKLKEILISCKNEEDSE